MPHITVCLHAAPDKTAWQTCKHAGCPTMIDIRCSTGRVGCYVSLRFRMLRLTRQHDRHQVPQRNRDMNGQVNSLTCARHAQAQTYRHVAGTQQAATPPAIAVLCSPAALLPVISFLAELLSADCLPRCTLAMLVSQVCLRRKCELTAGRALDEPAVGVLGAS